MLIIQQLVDFFLVVMLQTAYNQNVIQYVTMASTGNATDFGDLTVDAKMLQEELHRVILEQ